MEEADRTQEAAESKHPLGRRAAIVIAVMAALLAIATLSSEQASENVILAQERSTDTFNEYQADAIKQLTADNDAFALRQGGGSTSEVATRASALEKTAVHFREKQPALLEKAKGFGDARELAEKRHRTFQLAQASFQISIVLASVAIVASLSVLLYAASGLGVIGLLLLFNGLILLVKL